MPWNQFHAPLRWAIATSLGAFAFLFLLAPTRTFQSWLSPAIQTAFTKHQGLSLFLCVSLALAFWAVSLIIKAWELAPTGPTLPVHPNEISPKWSYVLAAICLFVFTRAVWDAQHTPLDWDEHSHTAMLSSPGLGPLRSIDPTASHSNHALASLLAWSSMRLFGISKFAARLPSLILTACFLWLVWQFSVRWLRPWSGLLVLGHLAVNPLLSWNFHSMRGYVPLVFFAFALFVITFEMTKKVGGARPLFSTLCLLGASFSHGMGAYYCVVLTVAFLGWLTLRRKELTRETLARGLQWLFLSAAVLPVLGFFAYIQVADLSSHNWINRTEVPQWEAAYNLSRMSLVVGLPLLWQGRLFLVLAATLTLFHFQSKKKADFSTLFVAALMVVYASTRFHLDISYLEGRFLLPFLTPCLVWWGVSQPTSGWRQPAVTLASLVVLLWLPSRVSYSTVDPLHAFWAGQEAFAEKVQQIISKPCLALSGNDHVVEHARDYYFHRYKVDPSCPYHAYYPYGPHQILSKASPSPLELPDPSALVPLHRDKLGRTLFGPPSHPGPIGQIFEENLL